MIGRGDRRLQEAPDAGVFGVGGCRADADALCLTVCDTLHVGSQPITRGGCARGWPYRRCDTLTDPFAIIMGRAIAIANTLVRGSLLTAAWLCVAFWAISAMRLSREPVLTTKLVANIKCAHSGLDRMHLHAISYS